jgi:hypothetical protein
MATQILCTVRELRSRSRCVARTIAASVEDRGRRYLIVAVPPADRHHEHSPTIAVRYLKPHIEDTGRLGTEFMVHSDQFPPRGM